jgi:hypothetical protein
VGTASHGGVSRERGGPQETHTSHTQNYTHLGVGTSVAAAMSSQRRDSTSSRGTGGLDVQIPDFEDGATEGMVLKYGDEVGCAVACWVALLEDHMLWPCGCGACQAFTHFPNVDRPPLVGSVGPLDDRSRRRVCTRVRMHVGAGLDDANTLLLRAFMLCTE